MREKKYLKKIEEIVASLVQDKGFSSVPMEATLSISMGTASFKTLTKLPKLIPLLLHLSFIFQDIAIDISDRPPSDQPQGIPYKLIGEACIPGITTITHDTVGSIFEEHLIVKQLNLFQYLTHDLASGSGVYGEDENKFIFYNTIVGRKARARFRIGNPNKVRRCFLFNVDN